MNPPTTDPAAVVCEIIADSIEQARTIARIAAACAFDVGQPVVIQTSRHARTTSPRQTATRVSVLTLHLPAELASTQNAIWCLACRLACFCPSVRVNVLVRCEKSFSTGSASVRRRMLAPAA
jgi:hypothetical protein